MGLSDIWDSIKDVYNDIRDKIVEQWEELKSNRKRRYGIIGFILFVIILIIILVLLLCRPVEEEIIIPPTPTPTATPPPVTVWIDAPSEVYPGSDFNVTVNISEVWDIDIAQYDICYNPYVLKVLDITDGVIGENVMPVDMWGYQPRCSVGCIRVLNNAPGVTGISGEGYLSEIQFHVLGSHDEDSYFNFVENFGSPPGV